MILSLFRIFRYPILLFILIALSFPGCGNTKWAATSNNDERDLYSAPGFSFKSMEGKTLAVGGVVLRDGAPLDEFCDIGVSRRHLSYEVQADLWSPALNSAVLALTPEMDIQFWHSVNNATPPELVEATHGILAHQGIIKPHILQDWARSLPTADFLALVRIDDTWIDGTGQSDWSRSKGLGRVVVVTLDIYDLHEGHSVWSYEVQKHVWGRDKGAATAEEGGNQNQGAGGMHGVDDQGTTKSAPTLLDALDDALNEVVKKLHNSEPRD
jgi:hypothetical protein